MTECAVVLTAGYGSRLFPVTSVVQKGLIPVMNLPVLHYVLADLVAAGVREIAIVVDRGDHTIRRYVEGAPDVEAGLKARGWEAKYEKIAAARAELAPARFTFIEQDVTTGNYGTAVPAGLAAEFVDGRSCFYVSGDDLLMAPGGGRNADDLGDLRSAAADCLAALEVTTVSADVADRYGMVQLRQSRGRRELESLVEKSPDRQGTHANISRYYFSPDAFREVAGMRPNRVTGEVMVTDALTQLQHHGTIGVSIASGTYFDCGSLDGWHEANVAMMRAGTSAR